MPRQPFVWEVQVTRELLDDDLMQLRELPYTLWRDVVNAPLTKTVTGRDGKSYRLTLEAKWARPGSENICVSVTLKGHTLRGRSIYESFVITPDNQFL